MLEKMRGLLDIEGLDYGDVRYENNSFVTISFENEELKKLSRTRREGGHLRIYQGGSKGVSSFTELNDARQGIATLLEAGKMATELKKEKVKLQEAPVYQDRALVEPESDPRKVSLQEKKELLEQYNELSLKQDKVIKTDFSYHEIYSRRNFVNLEGTELEYDLLGCYIGGRVYARNDDVVQSKRVAFGAYPEFDNLLEREDDLLEEIEILQQMVEADPIKAGSYPVIVNPDLASVFIHEAFGHLSEADGIENNPEFREKLQLGRKLGSEILTVIDDPGLEGTPGHYIYDDEGQLGRRTELIKDGLLAGRLHSRETAADFEEEISGNMKAVDCHFTPIIRMSNIFIAAGDSRPEELFDSIDNGYYLLNSRGGQTTGDQFTFGAEYGYRIENGEKKEMVRDINISGELFSTLERISLIADDLTFSEIGGCGKGSPMQINRFSGKGAPHVKIDRVNTGGI